MTMVDNGKWWPMANGGQSKMAANRQWWTMDIVGQWTMVNIRRWWTLDNDRHLWSMDNS